MINKLDFESKLDYIFLTLKNFIRLVVHLLFQSFHGTYINYIIYCDSFSTCENKFLIIFISIPTYI
jgi:hypothetical protein